MRLDLNNEEADLLKLLLTKDIEETRVEVHHAKNNDFKLQLQAHERAAQSLVERLQGKA